MDAIYYNQQNANCNVTMENVDSRRSNPTQCNLPSIQQATLVLPPRPKKDKKNKKDQK